MTEMQRTLAADCQRRGGGQARAELEQPLRQLHRLPLDLRGAERK